MRVEVTRFADAVVIKPLTVRPGPATQAPERSFALTPDELRILLRGLSEKDCERILSLPLGEPTFFEVPDPS